MTRFEHIFGCLLGTAIGDAIGLPREGLSRQRAQRMFGSKPLDHALIFRKGMCSDDTEQTVMLAQALIATGGDPAPLAKNFAARLRWWFIRLPAGVGLGTLRACLKLWVGFGPDRSGVNSAGNGAAMRSALLGLWAAETQRLVAMVTAATKVTHRDPRAEQGAQVVAEVSRLICETGGHEISIDRVEAGILPLARDEELRAQIEIAMAACRRASTLDQYLTDAGMSRGVSGYVNHTVPAALYCWLSHQKDFRGAVVTAVSMGGDTDTVAAIVGALAGAQNGADAIPARWVEGLVEWPCTVRWLETLARRVADAAESEGTSRPPRLPVSLLCCRNLGFLVIVLMHGVRRILPPY